MVFIVEIISEKSWNKLFQIKDEETTLGRFPCNDIVLPNSPLICRQNHIVFMFQNNLLKIRTSGSVEVNGIWYTENLIDFPMIHADVIGIGCRIIEQTLANENYYKARILEFPVSATAIN